MEEIAHNADVAALCDTGWVTAEAVAKIAVVRKRPKSVVYGPLRDMPVEPSVILLRLNASSRCCYTMRDLSCASKASRNAISFRSPKSAPRSP